MEIHTNAEVVFVHRWTILLFYCACQKLQVVQFIGMWIVYGVQRVINSAVNSFMTSYMQEQPNHNNNNNVNNNSKTKLYSNINCCHIFVCDLI